MFVRLFVHAKSETEAHLVLEKVLKIFSPILENNEIKKIEPYWKMDEAYIVELTMLISENQTEVELNKTLDCIANNWTRFGNPAIEFLASDTTQNCIFTLKGIKMINIQFE